MARYARYRGADIKRAAGGVQHASGAAARRRTDSDGPVAASRRRSVWVPVSVRISDSHGTSRQRCPVVSHRAAVLLHSVVAALTAFPTPGRRDAEEDFVIF